MKKCPYCGFETEEDDSLYCERCGTKYDEPVNREADQEEEQLDLQKKQDDSKKQQKTTGIKMLCMVLIGIGIATLGFIIYLIYSGNNSPDKEKELYVQKQEVEFNEEDEYFVLMEQLGKEYGKVSTESFITCDKTQIQAFPESGKGMINVCRCDFDFDTKEEVLAVVVDQNNTMQLLLYCIGRENDRFELESQQMIGELDPFGQITVEVFYNEKEEAFSVLTVQQIIGSYTGNEGFSCVLYTLKDKIEKSETWEWNKLIDGWEHLTEVQSEIRDSGIRHLHTKCLDFSDEMVENSYLLAKTEVSVIEGEVPTEYVVQMRVLDFDTLLEYNSSVYYERKGTQWNLTEQSEAEESEVEDYSAVEPESIDLSTDIREALSNKIAAGYVHTLAIRDDGTVKAGGDNSYGRCNVQNWTDIVSVAAGTGHSVGLKKDGTVVAVGDNSQGQCNVDSWSDIVAIAAGYKHTVGLRADGTVVAVGNNSYQQCNVSSWSKIKSIGCGVYHTLGILEDGTVIAVGDNSKGQCNVSSWKNVVKVEGGYYHSVALMEDQTIDAVGSNQYGQCDVGKFVGINQISCGEYCTVALTQQKTVMAAGLKEETMSTVKSWNELCAISAANNHVAGLGMDEMVYEAGTGYSEEIPSGIKFFNWK